MDLQTVSQTESKLLYILHWIILDAAEECADADFENGVNQHLQYYYLFPITSITVSTQRYSSRIPITILPIYLPRVINIIIILV